MKHDLRMEIAAMLRAQCADPRDALLLLAQLTNGIITHAPAAQRASLFGMVVLVIGRDIVLS